MRANMRRCATSTTMRSRSFGSYGPENNVNYRDDKRRGLDVGVVPATLL